MTNIEVAALKYLIFNIGLKPGWSMLHKDVPGGHKAGVRRLVSRGVLRRSQVLPFTVFLMTEAAENEFAEWQRQQVNA